MVVVDVEDNDYTAFRNLTPHDGGLGGWRLLSERINPFGSWLGRWFPRTVHRRGVARERRRRRRRREQERRESNRRPRPSPPPLPPTPPAQRPHHRPRRHASVVTSAQGEEGTRGEPLPRPPGVSGWVAPLTPNRVDALVRRAHGSTRAGRSRIGGARRPRAGRSGTRTPRGRRLETWQSRGRFHLGSTACGPAPRRDTGVTTPSARGDRGVATPSTRAATTTTSSRRRGGARGNEGDEGRHATGFARRRRRTTPVDSGRALGARRDRRRRRTIAADVAGAPDAPKDQRDALPAPAPRAPGLAPEGVREGLVPRAGRDDGARRDAPSPAAATTPRGPRTSSERRLVLQIHRPPPRRGVRAPNDDDDRYEKPLRTSDDPAWGEIRRRRDWDLEDWTGRGRRSPLQGDAIASGMIDRRRRRRPAGRVAGASPGRCTCSRSSSHRCTRRTPTTMPRRKPEPKRRSVIEQEVADRMGIHPRRTRGQRP